MVDSVERRRQIRVEHPPAASGFCPCSPGRSPRSRHGSHGRAGTHRTSARTAPPTRAPTRPRHALAARGRAITGIPSGRRFPVLPCFGIYTRLTGQALNGSVLCCTRRPGQSWPSGSAPPRPSTPAVLRPALRSVTRRTLKSVLARERSINFCRLRTRFRSPACDAVKIRCRKHRTLLLSRHASQQRPSREPRPLVRSPRIVVASNLSFGSGAIVIFLFTGSPDRVSALSGPGTSPVSGQLSGTASGGPAIMSRFPVAFRLPAFASRSSDSRPGAWAFLTVGLPGQSGRTPTGLPRSARCELRPGWVPPVPRGRRCSSG